MFLAFEIFTPKRVK